MNSENNSRANSSAEHDHSKKKKTSNQKHKKAESMVKKTPSKKGSTVKAPSHKTPSKKIVAPKASRSKATTKDSTKTFKTSHKILLVVLSMAVLIIFFVGRHYYNVYNNLTEANFKVRHGESIALQIYPYTTFEDICLFLEEKDCVQDLHSFKKVALSRHLDKNLRPGNYRIEQNMTNRLLVNRLLSGSQQPVRVTFNNIRLKSHLIHKLSSQLLMGSLSLDSTLKNKTLLKSYGFTPENCLALFIPNSYELYWTITPEQFLKKMFQEYTRFWNDERLEKAEALDLSPLEVSTLASIVEEESTDAYEKRIIAGLYLNRLRRNMRLESDPTVRFAVGDFTVVQILNKGLTIDSPYNTYKYAGLPPAPIRCPSINGLDAVLNYIPSDYIFMCAKPELNGKHNFASTLREHNRNARAYHKAFRQWKRKNKK